MRTCKVIIHPNNKQTTKIRKTLNKCGLILNRDLNAAINLANYININ